MRITFTDLVFRVLTRYSALLLFLALTIVALLALRCITKAGGRPLLPTVLAVGILLCSVAAQIVVAPVVWRSGARILQVLQAAFSTSIAGASGPFAVAETKVALAPLTGSGRLREETVVVHLFYPDQAASHPSTTNGSPMACEQLQGTLNLPASASPYRIVLLAPGLGGTPGAMRFISRNMASHGYVVVGLNDPAREASAPDAIPGDEEIWLRPFDFSSEQALAATMRRGSVRAEYVASRALAALDRLETCIGKGGPADVINFAHVGFVGYSFGGSAAAESAFLDSRIAAVVNLDGSLFGRASRAPIEVPYLMMHSDFSKQVLYDPHSPRRHEYMLDQNDLRLAETQSKHSASHLFVIRNSFHDTFADPLPGARSILKWLLLDPNRAQLIINDYLIGFLDAYLKGVSHGPLRANDPRYPEVEVLSSD